MTVRARKGQDMNLSNEAVNYVRTTKFMEVSITSKQTNISNTTSGRRTRNNGVYKVYQPPSVLRCGWKFVYSVIKIYNAAKSQQVTVGACYTPTVDCDLLSIGVEKRKEAAQEDNPEEPTGSAGSLKSEMMG